MREIDKYILNVINDSLKSNYRPYTINYNDVKIKDVFDVAKEHCIETVIYNTVKKDFKLIDNNVKILEEWKKRVFHIAISQKKYIVLFYEVLDEFNKNNIEIIMLKGLVIRNLYPIPELRSMGDMDILIKKDDFEKVSCILEKYGYKMEENRDENGIDIGFECINKNRIEVHWKLLNPIKFRNLGEFENEIWKRKIKINYKENDVISLNENDIILYLCIHMAKHFKYSGFGLRQLSDLYLVVNKYKEKIDWINFREKCKHYRINKFVDVIFIILKKVFGIDIPFLISEYSKYEQCSERVLEEIIKSGVFGRSDMVRARGIAMQNKSIVFVSKSELNYRYRYGKDNNLFYMIAIIHRLIFMITTRKFSIKEKVKLIREIKKNKKLELINFLEL